jgi:hypothetical protein
VQPVDSFARDAASRRPDSFAAVAVSGFGSSVLYRGLTQVLRGSVGR